MGARIVVAIMVAAASACSPPRECFAALEAYTRAARAAPSDESDSARVAERAQR